MARAGYYSDIRRQGRPFHLKRKVKLVSKKLCHLTDVKRGHNGVQEVRLPFRQSSVSSRASIFQTIALPFDLGPPSSHIVWRADRHAERLPPSKAHLRISSAPLPPRKHIEVFSVIFDVFRAKLVSCREIGFTCYTEHSEIIGQCDGSIIKKNVVIWAQTEDICFNIWPIVWNPQGFDVGTL